MVEEPQTLTEYSTTVCQEKLPGHDLLQLEADMVDYNGGKYIEV